MGISNDWFGTCYRLNSYKPDEGKNTIHYVGYNENHEEKDCVYYFGMDPLWTISTNYLTFTNNIKEKLSVIIAYFHLNFGIFLNALNCIHRGDWKRLVFDIFTGFFIFLGLIGFMIILIYVKWWFPVNPYYIPKQPYDPTKLNITTSPAIINLLIGDVMGLTGFAPKNELAYQFWDSQQATSNALVYITFICLPVMLCAIPCIHICCGPRAHHDDDDEVVGVNAHKDEEERGLIG